MSEIPISPFESERDSQLAGKICKKLLMKQVVGSHKKRIDTVKNWFPSHQQGLVEDLIETMLRKPSCPLEGYGGGHRSNIRLRDYQEAKEFVAARNFDTEWL